MGWSEREYEAGAEGIMTCLSSWYTKARGMQDAGVRSGDMTLMMMQRNIQYASSITVYISPHSLIRTTSFGLRVSSTWRR